MVVQHNLTAMNSNRMLGVTSKSQAKSTEKLSSGYKINRAADDAAGLSISEKMRKQIRGLTQASSNAQDGISAVQTAEGALTEVHDMLQRMNELAVKAANGTNSSDDREYIQNEVDQLISEIDRVSETTKFNETYLLKGDTSAASEYSFNYATTTTYTVKTGANVYTAAGVKLNDGDTLATGTDYFTVIEGTGTAATAADTNNVSPYIANKILYNANGTVAFASGASMTDEQATTNIGNYFTGIQVNATSEITDLALSTALDSSSATAKYYDSNGNVISENGLTNYLETADGINITAKAGTALYDQDGNTVAFAAGNFSITANTGALSLSLHVGADSASDNKISVELHAMSAVGLGVDSLKVNGADGTNATDAIETIKAAIQKVSTQRSSLGAVQNRLEHTINNLDNVVENTTSAESSIRDTDMATEMVKYSNNNILAQAGQSMLAQANQSNQGVLSLLQ